VSYLPATQEADSASSVGFLPFAQIYEAVCNVFKIEASLEYFASVF
jgi:hypothetical protein